MSVAVTESPLAVTVLDPPTKASVVPWISASDIITATLTRPPDAPWVVGSTEALEVADTSTLLPFAVKAPPFSEASVVPLIVVVESAPAPAPPMDAETERTVVEVVIVGVLVAVTEMLPLDAVMEAPSTKAETLSEIVLEAWESPTASPVSPTAMDAVSTSASRVAVSPALTLTAPEAVRFDELSTQAWTVFARPSED